MSQQIETKHLDNVLANHTQDMGGRVAAVTGTTSGTGYVCARELARKGASVLLLNRPSSRVTGSLERLRAAIPEGTFVSVECDLQHFDSVRAAIETIRADHDRLDVLCNNAGVMALPDEATPDG